PRLRSHRYSHAPLNPVWPVSRTFRPRQKPASPRSSGRVTPGGGDPRVSLMRANTIAVRGAWGAPDATRFARRFESAYSGIFADFAPARTHLCIGRAPA